jgi:hypothetical protein
MRDSDYVEDSGDLPGARERAIDERENRADARDAAQAEREARTRGILADADERDVQADARDSAADGRDRAASLDSFLRDDHSDNDAALKSRRAGALDRLDSKGDREAAAEDRSHLAEGVGPAGDAGV